ncbi:MAG: acetyl-CoA acetyltransferase [Candidatus Dadabacteria bacterium]|nr:MAG: acetyl-CoA acetyltransferase [Candidatus Dadabacteria bacterium]
MHDSRVPVIVGVGQVTQRWCPDGPHHDALGLMTEAARRALADAASPRIGATIDVVAVVNTVTWSYRDAPGQVCSRLGLEPGRRIYTGIGGNTPQFLVNRFAREIEAGQIRSALICGAEAGYSARKVAAGADFGWPPPGEPERIDGDNRLGSSDYEIAYDLVLPAFVYPFFETALRAAAGRSPADHTRFLGWLCSRMSAVAAGHPYAWLQEPLTPEEIATVTDDNRMVGYPYTKRMNANMSVDQGAAIVVTSEGVAARLGIDRERWVYPMGGADLCDVWEFTRRPCLHESPAIRAAIAAALEQAGVGLDAIDFFDFYSCFPSAVQIGLKAAGLPADDPRGVTVTGGLPYFGGPGNNYSSHAIATVVEKIRNDRTRHALVTALGWYITKHSVGVYGGRPRRIPWNESNCSREQAQIDARALPEPVQEYSGNLVIEAFSIRHRRAGPPRRGWLLGRDRQGRRVLAEIDASPEELLDLEAEEIVGLRARCRYDSASGLNRARVLV